MKRLGLYVLLLLTCAQQPLLAEENRLAADPMTQLPRTEAQAAMDTLDAKTARRAMAENDPYRLGWRRVVVPAAVTGAAALFLIDGWPSDAKESVQDALSAEGRHTTRVDDYLRFAPLAAAFALEPCGVKGRHGLADRAIIAAMSYATMGVAVGALKYTVREPRPGNGERTSFPSGHAAIAFVGAELLRSEYAEVSPWIGVAGYVAAAATGYLRIYNNRHYFNDVIAGAALGVLSVRLSYWLYPKLFPRRAERNRSRRDVAVLGAPFYADGAAGVGLTVLF